MKLYDKLNEVTGENYDIKTWAIIGASGDVYNLFNLRKYNIQEGWFIDHVLTVFRVAYDLLKSDLLKCDLDSIDDYVCLNRDDFLKLNIEDRISAEKRALLYTSDSVYVSCHMDRLGVDFKEFSRTLLKRYRDTYFDLEE